MKLLKWFKPKKNLIYNNDDSYRFVFYKIGLNNEMIWNGTNKEAPKYIISKNKKYKLIKNYSIGEPNPKHVPTKGTRFLRYKTEQEILDDKMKLLQTYWNLNINNCRSSYTDFNSYVKLHDTGLKKYVVLDEA